MAELRVPVTDETYQRWKNYCQSIGSNPTVETRKLIFDELRRNEQPVTVKMLPGQQQHLTRYYQQRGTTLDAVLTKMTIKLYQDTLGS